MRLVTGTLLFALLLSGAISVGAASRTAASCSATDVQAALNSAQSGDTVFIPAGTCHWSSRVTWNAPANTSLIGAGSLSVVGGGDATVIIDDSGINGALLSIATNGSGSFRLAGLTFQGGTGVQKDNSGIVQINGPSSNVRIDHIHINTQTYSDGNARGSKVMYLTDRVFGVVDHSVFDLFANAAIYIVNGAGTDTQGNNTWASPTNFGGSNFMYFEDNRFNCEVTWACRAGDSWSAARIVERFNTYKGVSGIEEHATGHSGDDRGTRAKETYGNRYMVLPGHLQPPYDMASVAAGTALIWGNVADANALKNGIILDVTRKSNTTYPEPTPPGGWGYCGTEFNGAGSPWDRNSDTATGYPCLDQPGRGQGQLLNGTFPSKINTATGTISWPNQALEPIYIANNSFAPANGWGGAFYVNPTNGRVAPDRDYYPQASGTQTSPSSPFNGSSGTGWGTLANRPTSCTTGVGYLASDGPTNWNTVANAEGTQLNGTDWALYTCTSTNSWTLYYTPYTYPHPLTTGGSQGQSSGVPMAPSSLRIVSGGA